MSENGINRPQSERTGRDGVYIVSLLVSRYLHWTLREQTVSDYGIDAHIEILDDEGATGMLIAAQIKSGPSVFARPAKGGWHYTVDAPHANYWKRHSLPVILILVDTENDRAYWEIVDDRTLISTGKNFKVLVPESHELRDAGKDLESFTAEYAGNTELRYAAQIDGLSPAVRRQLSALRDTSYYAAGVLAADLAAGRADPPAAIRELRHARSSWLDTLPVHGWRALLQFARDHDDNASAADIHRHLAEQDAPDLSAAHLAQAALRTMGSDLVAARELAMRARELAPNVVAVRVANAYLGHEVEAAEKSLRGSEDQLAIHYFARKAILAGDDTEAIRLLERAVAANPESVPTHVYLAKAFLHRAATPHAFSGDSAAAIKHARTALDRHRVYSDSTAGTLEHLLVALGNQSLYADLLEAATPPPLGMAAPHEACSPEIVRLAMHAARRINRHDLEPQIARQLKDAKDRRRALLKRPSAPEPTQTRTAFHERALDHAVRAKHEETAVGIAIQLATLGVDVSARLREFPNVTEPTLHLLRTVAAAGDRDERSLPELRALARSEIIAAEVVIDILQRRPDSTAAVDAADLYFQIYKAPSFLMSMTYVHLGHGETVQAMSVLSGALADGHLTGEDKRSAHLLLGEHRSGHGEWSDAKTHFAAALKENRFTTKGPFWYLIQTLLALGDENAARALCEEHNHLPSSDQEISLWAHVHATTGWTNTSAKQALELAEDEARAPDLAVKLAGSIVGSTRGKRLTIFEAADSDDEDSADMDVVGEEMERDSRPEVDGELHARAFRLMSGLHGQHGDSLGIQIGDGGAEALLEKVTALLHARKDKGTEELRRNIARGAMPYGMLTQLTAAPFTLLLVSRMGDLRIASNADPERHHVETENAAQALGGSVVVDLSAIDLAVELDVWDEASAQFNVITIPLAQKRDATASIAHARNDTASKGHLGLDYEGHPRMTLSDPVRASAILERCRVLHAATAGLRSASSVTPEELPEELRELCQDAWMSALALAIAKGAALWADDLGLRSLAAEFGVKTFGTVNLLEAQILDRINTAASPDELDSAVAAQRELLITLIEHRVADQPVGPAIIIENIELHPDELAPAADLLRRGTWWAATETIHPWADIIRAVRTHAPATVRDWQARAISGIVESMPTPYGVGVVATLVAMGTLEATTLDDVLEGSSVADIICRERELPRPSLILPLIAQQQSMCEPGQSPEDFLTALMERLAPDESTAAPSAHAQR